MIEGIVLEPFLPDLTGHEDDRPPEPAPCWHEVRRELEASRFVPLHTESTDGEAGEPAGGLTSGCQTGQVNDAPGISSESASLPPRLDGVSGAAHDALPDTQTARAEATAEALALFIAEGKRAREQLAYRFENALGAAAEACLENLLDSHFAAEVAAMAGAILAKLPDPWLELHTAATDAEAVSRAISERRIGPGVSLEAEDRLAPGQIRLTWQNGGGEIDLNAMHEAARRVFHLHFSESGKET